MKWFGLVAIVALAIGGPSGAWAQALGGSCTGSGITSPVADGGLLKCNGSTYAAATIYVGALGVGTSNPATSLEVRQDVNNGIAAIQVSNQTTGASSQARLNMATGTANAYVINAVIDNAANPYYQLVAGNGIKTAYFDMPNFYFRTPSGTVLLNIMTNGNAALAGTLTQNSDARLKTNIQQLPADVFEKLALIRGVTFNWKDNDRDSRQQMGVIAQDVQRAYPQLVTADASGTLSVNYNGLVAPLIEAVKHLKAENVELQQELASDRKQAALDHDLLFKVRQKVLLPDYQMTPYTESAWQYVPQPKGWKSAAIPPRAGR